MVSQQVSEELINSLSLITSKQIIKQIEKFKIEELPKNILDEEFKILTQGMKEDEIKKNKKSLEDGYTQPKNIVNGVIAQIDAILNSEIEDNPYFKIFSNSDDGNLKKSVQELIIKKINPAYKDLNNFLKNEYLISSRSTIGISDVPNGKDYYKFLAKKFTTTDLSPDEIHEIGWDELRRIRSEMEQIISDVNWEGNFSSFLNYLRTDPKFYYDNPEDLFNAYLIMSKL